MNLDAVTSASPLLSTRRLTLRPARTTDAAQIAAYRSLEETCRYVPFAPMDAAAVAERIDAHWNRHEPDRGNITFAVPFILFVLVASLVLLPRHREKQKRMPLDVLGALLLTSAPLLFAFGAVEAGEPGSGVPWSALVALVGAAVTGILFVVVERRARNPLVPLAFFQSRARVRANAATALLSAALSTSFLLFAFYLQGELGLSPLAAGLILVPLAIALVVAVAVVPPLLDRWGAHVCAVTGLACAAAGMIAIAVAAQFRAPAWLVVPAMLLIAAGMGFGLVGLQYAAVDGVSEDDAGIASGVQRAADQLGGSAGVALYIGVGFVSIGDAISPYVVASSLAVAGLVVAAIVASRIRSRGHSERFVPSAT